jgi:choice-of-anchor B domain-containing protein
MPNCRGGRRPGVFAAVVACVAAVVPPSAPAQVFDFDNVVMTAHRDLFPGYNDVWGFVGNDGHEYIIQGLTTGTAWWDVDDPVNPVLVKMIPAPSSTWRDMFVIGDYAYVGCENNGCGIQIIDISDPTDPVEVGVYSTTVGNSHNIFGDVARNLIYVYGSNDGPTPNGGLQILDVSNPVAPVNIGNWDNFYIHDAAAEDSLLHLCLINQGRLRIINVADSTNPVGYGTRFQDPVGSVHASWPVGDGVHVLIAHETTNGHVKSLDYSVPTAITEVSAYNPATGASAHNVHVEGTRAFVSWYALGTRILDVSDPTNLTPIGYWDTYPDTNAGGVGPGNWGVYPHLPSGLIAANDGKYGLFLLQYDPDAGTIDGTVSSSAGGLLAGVTVEFLDLNITQTTDGTGAYRFSAFPGAGRTVRFSAFGHQTDSITVNVPVDGAVTTPVVLTKLPAGGLDGTVTDAVTTLPLEGVEIAIVGAPLSAVTDSTGTYGFPDVPSGAYSMTVLRYGYAPATAPATVTANVTNTEDVALQPGAIFADFSSTAGWVADNTEFSVDPANATGEWVFAEPWGTYSSGIPFQPEFDHTLSPEDQCAVTGNASTGAIGGDDVDSLTTRLLSPVYDLSAMAEPHVFYYRWYAVNGADEPWEVEATTNGGANWTLLETSVANENFWKGVDVDLSGLLGSFGAVQLRFTAQDPTNAQVVEAALDDVTIYDANPGGAVGAPVLPDRRLRLELAQNFPNPWAAATEIRFAVPEKQHVQLSVFDVRGARVATLVDTELGAGFHRAAWDGRSFTGDRAAAGVYFYKLQTKQEIRTRKMVRLN